MVSLAVTTSSSNRRKTGFHIHQHFLFSSSSHRDLPSCLSRFPSPLFAYASGLSIRFFDPFIQMPSSCSTHHFVPLPRSRFLPVPSFVHSRLVHDGAEPKPCTANVKWPQNGNLQQGPCLKNTMVPASERSQSPLSPSANASPTCYGSARNCDPIKHDPRMARPRSTCRSSPRSGERPKCECPGGKKATEYNAWTAAKKPPSYAPSVRCLIVGSAAGSCASKASKATNVRRAKKNRIISPITTPEHYQFPYFGHSRTYVTDPALSPNLTPPGRRSMRLPGQEKIQFAEFASKPKCALLDKPNDIPHLPDAKTSWFGRTKTYVTDPAVSPNLTPPLRG